MEIGYGQAQEIEVRYDNSTSPGQDCAYSIPKSKLQSVKTLTQSVLRHRETTDCSL